MESNVAEIRAKIDQARTWRDLRGETTILFIDEIHRFNKAQQDVLLPHIERGTVRFIGATTHNPYFYVNSPLVSRSQIFQLEPVPVDDVDPRAGARARRHGARLGNHSSRRPMPTPCATSRRSPTATCARRSPRSSSPS